MVVWAVLLLNISLQVNKLTLNFIAKHIMEYFGPLSYGYVCIMTKSLKVSVW